MAEDLDTIDVKLVLILLSICFLIDGDVVLVPSFNFEYAQVNQFIKLVFVVIH